MDRQDKSFWCYIKEYNFIGLSEIWINEKRWREIKGWLPESHIWYVKYAKREKERGRAKGGLLIGMRKVWGGRESEFIETGSDGIDHVRIKEAGGNLNIVVVYNKENGKEKEMGEEIKKITENTRGKG